MINLDLKLKVKCQYGLKVGRYGLKVAPDDLCGNLCFMDYDDGSTMDADPLKTLPTLRLDLSVPHHLRLSASSLMSTRVYNFLNLFDVKSIGFQFLSVYVFNMYCNGFSMNEMSLGVLVLNSDTSFATVGEWTGILYIHVI